MSVFPCDTCIVLCSHVPVTPTVLMEWVWEGPWTIGVPAECSSWKRAWATLCWCLLDASPRVALRCRGLEQAFPSKQGLAHFGPQAKSSLPSVSYLKLRYNSYTIKFTLLKSTVWWVLVHSQGCITIITIVLTRRHFHHPNRKPLPISSTCSFLFSLAATSLLSVYGFAYVGHFK